MQSKIKIAIVEDEIFIATNLKFTLEDLGYEVVFCAHNYQTAIEAINSNEFDVILLDIQLKGSPKTGFDIAAYLNENKKSIFIFLTAYSDLETIKEAVNFKPSAYLIKPINEGSLFAAIQTAVYNFDNHFEAKMPHQEKLEIDYFFTKIGTKIVKILWTDIYMLVATKNYVSFVSTIGNREYPVRSSLSQAIDKIVPLGQRKRYIQVNRSTFLDASIIQSLDAKNVYTAYGTFEIGKSFFEDIKNRFTTD